MPLHEYLTKTHGDKPFDAIFEVAGDTTLHQKCSRFTKTDAFFVSLGALTVGKDPSWFGLLRFAILGKLERFRPRVLGGVPRKHCMLNATPGEGRLQKVVRLVEDGKLKVVLDGVWDMEDAKQVSRRTA